MTDAASSPAHAPHAGPGIKAYLGVFAALSVFTAVSFVFYEALPRDTSFILILLVAVAKALLVGAIFMHLVLDWGKVYYLIVPAFILGALLIIVLMPDIVLGWHHPGANPTP